MTDCQFCQDLKGQAASWAIEIAEPDVWDTKMLSAELIARGLMIDDLPRFHRGYSVDNAALAAVEYVYGLTNRGSMAKEPDQVSILKIRLETEPTEKVSSAVGHLADGVCVHTVERI